MSVKEIGFCNDKGEFKLTNINDNELNGSISSTLSCWTLNELVPLTSIKCKIPNKIVIFMRTIENLMRSHNMGSLEFGIFLKGSFSNGILNVNGDCHYIPKQKVSAGSVDFEEDPPSPDFNGVIHRHPTGCKSFSGVDDKYINRNFDFSLLYEGNEIIKGIINIKCENFRVQLPLDIEIQYPVFQIENPEVIFDKIKKSVPLVCNGFGKSDFRISSSFLPGLADDDLLQFGETEEELVEETDFEELDDTTYCPKCGEVIDIDFYPFTCECCGYMVRSEEDLF